MKTSIVVGRHLRQSCNTSLSASLSTSASQSNLDWS